MKIVVLVFPSRRRDNSPIFDEAIQIATSARMRGHEVEVLNVTHFTFLFDSNRTTLYYKDKPFEDPDVVVAWMGMLNGVAERSAVLQEIELRGIPVINKRLPIIRTRNKFQTMQILSSIGLPVIKTVMIHDLAGLDLAIENLGGFPVVVKTVYGNDGKGVAIFESKRSLLSGLELMMDNNVEAETILLQEFVVTDNKDYRCFVVGDRVVAQMERSAAAGDFRANLSSGGQGRKASLSAEVQALAVEAARCLDLDISGVDILLEKDGTPVICEVNPRPGFKICKITGVNVADHIIDHAERRVKFVHESEPLSLAANV